MAAESGAEAASVLSINNEEDRGCVNGRMAPRGPKLLSCPVGKTLPLLVECENCGHNLE